MASEAIPQKTVTTTSSVPRIRRRGLKFQRFMGKTLALFLLLAGSIAVLLPLVWMLSTSLKARENATEFPPSWIPQESIKTEYNGRMYFMYDIPVDGETRRLGLLKKQPGGMGIFFEPENPDVQYTLKIADGEKAMKTVIHWENYKIGLTMVPFARYMWNTMIIVITTTIGVIVSCTLVAYGFSRFRAPGLNILFLILLSTIMLPAQVTLIPQFVFFKKIGWYDTFLPLIIPAFFANAWDVFLLRQFFMTVPLEMDEAARIDGANPIQILLFILVPQCWPAIATVSIFHFLFAWNDFFGPLIYIQSQEKWTIALGLQSFSGLYSQQITYLMAAATVTMLPCLILFFVAQKLFIQGVVVSGVKG
jgi:multiple sugar transport system permease protein